MKTVADLVAWLKPQDEGYEAAFADLRASAAQLRADGHAIDHVDLGGGLGIPYRNQPTPSPTALAQVIKGAFHNLDVRLALEPGRWLVGTTGVLLSSVILVKQAPGARFVVQLPVARA